eukprot:COSAG05_NODE_172_length_14980_cov_10.662791_7_plen_73_part_00
MAQVQQIWAAEICQQDHMPVLSVRVNGAKAFAFVELSTPEITDAVYTRLNNCVMGNSPHCLYCLSETLRRGV